MALTDRPSSSSPDSRQSAVAKRLRKQIALGWVFLAFWGLFVVAFNGSFLVAAANQIIAAQTWRTTTGTIQSSRVVVSSIGKGKFRHRPTVMYTYQVDGREYTSLAIAAGTPDSMQSRNKAYAERVIRANPVGATVPVFYDAADPRRAALAVGLQTQTVLMLFFAIPFDVVAIGVAVFLLRAQRAADDPLLGRLVRDDGTIAVVRFGTFWPATAGCLGAGVSAFALIFGLMFWYSGDPPMEAIAAATVAVVLSGLACYALRARAISAGRYDLIVDRQIRQLTLPSRRRDLDRAILRFDALSKIELRLDDGRKVNRKSTWQLVFAGRGLDGERIVAYWLESADATRLGKWLARETGVRVSRTVGGDSLAETGAEAEENSD